MRKTEQEETLSSTLSSSIISPTCVQEGTYLCIYTHLCTLMNVHGPRDSKCSQESAVQGQGAVTVMGALPDSLF